MLKVAAVCAVGLLGSLACASESDDGSDAMAQPTGAEGNATEPESAGPSALPTEAPGRERLTCAELETQIETASANVDFDIEVTLGTWNDVPDELKVLPEGAELCGSLDALNQGIVNSELWGPPLESYYRPVFEGLGCAPFTCEVLSSGDVQQIRCFCSSDDGFGEVIAQSDIAYYLLTFF